MTTNGRDWGHRSGRPTIRGLIRGPIRGLISEVWLSMLNHGVG